MLRSGRAVLAVACIFTLLACDDDTGPGDTEEFDATLSAAAEVPPTGITATGTATFTVRGSMLSWTVAVVGIDSVTAGHIHAGAAGDNGGIMVDLGLTPTGVGFTGTLAIDSATVADSVLVRMRAGTAYVNVHTKANPAGAIRGQIVAQ
jgi:hypothetical protein